MSPAGEAQVTVGAAQQLQDVAAQLAGVRELLVGHDQLPVGGEPERGAVGPAAIDRVLVGAGALATRSMVSPE